MAALSSLTVLGSKFRRWLNGEDGSPSPIGNFAKDVDLGDRLNRASLADPVNWFQSTEQTGTGGAQNIAHGLLDASGAPRTPSMVIVTVTDNNGGGAVIVEGAHDDTNVIITMTSGAKYKVYAV